MDTKKEEKKKNHAREKRIAVGTTLALLTAASVTVGGLFNDPAALLQEDELKPGVVYVMDNSADDDDGGAQQEDETEKRRGGVRAALRRRILALPLIVRMVVVLPLWAVGWALTAAMAALWTSALSPLAAKLFGALLMFGMLALVFALAVKAIFPDLPLRKIFSRRSLVALAIGALALFAADLVLPILWTEYERAKALVTAAGMLIVLTPTVTAFSLREQKRRREQLKKAAEEERRAQEEAKKLPDVLEFTDAGGSFTVRVPRSI